MILPICMMHIYDLHSTAPWTDDSLDHPTERSPSKPVGLTAGLIQVMTSYEGRSLPKETARIPHKVKTQ